MSPYFWRSTLFFFASDVSGRWLLANFQSEEGLLRLHNPETALPGLIKTKYRPCRLGKLQGEFQSVWVFLPPTFTWSRALWDAVQKCEGRERKQGETILGCLCSKTGWRRGGRMQSPVGMKSCWLERTSCCLHQLVFKFGRAKSSPLRNEDWLAYWGQGLSSNCSQLEQCTPSPPSDIAYSLLALMKEAKFLADLLACFRFRFARSAVLYKLDFDSVLISTVISLWYIFI